ncbi:regulator of protease activity HflC (stomatin/prohibitin superfamily) [Inhella inkyongensis]|uniref:Regulator of protease activity HflC (Stomatin/prohibitin superfamily) n=1 Tax=Inhella inkyongensis TaxID=392593 RepID=A0A840S4R4_9BURK|nr:SPFH domain-containing protein [Inhella inkyongensis]MBB5204693.1 regulator of protease activity HflC (stomatin/prohibitin superfamily) [Inhella inkyongensis]
MNFRTPLLLALTAALAACTQIDTGNVGVERTLGKVSPEALPPGVYFSLFKTVDEFSAKEVSFQLNDMTPKSRDNLTMKDVDIDIYFKVNPAAVPGLYTKYQGDVVRHKDVVREGGTKDKVIAYSRVSREAREAVYKSIAQLDATTMHTKRSELAELVRSGLQSELDANDKGAFVITAVNVRNLLTDPAIEAAIRQRAETDQAIEKKRKEIELAKAEAERLIVEAEGQAKANQIVSASLTPALKEIKLAELQRDAAIAIASKQGNTVLLGGGAQPLINVGK